MWVENVSPQCLADLCKHRLCFGCPSFRLISSELCLKGPILRSFRAVQSAPLASNRRFSSLFGALQFIYSITSHDFSLRSNLERPLFS